LVQTRIDPRPLLGDSGLLLRDQASLSVMDDIETLRREARSARLKLVAVCIFLGFLLGLGAGLLIADHTIERTVIIPLEPGQKI